MKRWLLLVLLTLSLFALVPSISMAQTYTESVLYSFPFSDAGVGQYNVVIDSAGNLYGAEANGGPNYDCDFGESPCGQIFKISKDGVFSTAYAFTKHSKGAGPLYLVIDNAGNLYGTTYELAGDSGEPETVFKYATKTKKFTTLASFNDGPQPVLSINPAGNLFGTTFYGGGSGGDNSTIFEITAKGVESTLYSFNNGGPLDGYYAESVLGSDRGDLYGVVITPNGAPGYLYEVTSSGVESILNDNLPNNPGYISRDSAGNFYGGSGTGLWEVLGSNHSLVEYTFSGLSGISGPLTLSNGIIYGVAAGGGTNGGGAVFEFDESTGIETTLYNFCSLSNCTDGNSPQGNVAIDSKGNLYGVTSAGGRGNLSSGVVFKLTKN